MSTYFRSTGDSWLILELPIRTVSEANVRQHRMAVAKRAKEQRKIARGWLDANRIGGALPPLPVTIILDRFGPARLDDDNLRRALKACRDGVADAYGVDDRDPRITWRYGQAATRDEYSVMFTILGGKK